MGGGTPEAGIGPTGGYTAQGAHQRGDQLQIGRGGLDDQEAGGKCPQDDQQLPEAHFLLQQQGGKDHSKEGGQLVEHIGIGQVDTADGVEVADQAQSAQKDPPQHQKPALPIQFGGHTIPKHDDPCDQRGHKVAEKRLFKGVDIPRQAHAGVHQRKAQRRQHNK